MRWIRPFYLYPQQVTDDLLDLYAGEEKITKYIDMPLQHINDRMLKRMHRLGDRAAIDALVNRIRTRVPGVAFRTAFIVGFPGETEAEFEELLAFLDAAQLDRVGCFAYSAVDGAVANALPNPVPEPVKQERLARFMAVQAEISAARLVRKVGRSLDVLVDAVTGEVASARSAADAPEIDGVVTIDGGGKLAAGDFARVTITSAGEHDLRGRVAA